MIDGKTYAVDVHPSDYATELRLARYFASHTCRKCGQNNVTDTMPCPFCSAKAKPVSVQVKQTKPNWKEVKVQSATTPGMYYIMECEKKGRKVLRCSCPGFKYRKSCHHKTSYEGK